jgi:EF-P beta-lysylation protein EpmB
MITRTAPSWHTEDWQFLLSNSIRSPESLWRRLNLPLDTLPAALKGHADFPIRVPEPYLDKINPADLSDPLLLQVLPLAQESEVQPGFVADPLGERSTNPQPGLLHKYKSRVLVMLSGACAINCRYCFRRHFPYQDNRLSNQEFGYIQTYLARHPEVNEVILSGGDPLVASNARLGKLLKNIESCTNVTRLRVHARLPVVIPQRIDMGLLDLLRDTRLKTVLVTHSNHPNELDSVFDDAMSALQQAGVTLLNQSVLLRGVNDSGAVLQALSERLFQAGVLPYYLHLLDPVAGAHHFDVPESEARGLMRFLQQELPGFLIPRLVREISGKSGKTLIDLHLS